MEGSHHSNKLQNSFNKYGIDCFHFEVLETYDEIDYNDLLKREQFWMDYYDSYNNGYNSRPKAESNYGHKHSEETKKLLSKLNSGENNAMYGKKLSEEQKQKISRKLKGRKDKPDTIEKKRKAGLNRKHSVDTKKKQMLIKKSKPILQLDLEGNIIKKWYSKREPLRELGLRVDYVVKSNKKFKDGYYWVYESDYDLFYESFK